MNTRAFALCALVALAGMTATTGCQPLRSRFGHGRPIARIFEGKARRPAAEISESEVRQAFGRLRLEREGSIHAAPLPPTLRDVALDQLIDERILLLEAARLGVKSSTKAVAREVARMRRDTGDAYFERLLLDTYQSEADLTRAIDVRFTIGALMTQQAHQGVSVSDADLQKAWKALPPSERLKPARCHAAQIVVRTQEEADLVLKELHKGDFGEVARRHSISRDRENGGDLGWFEAIDVPRAIADACGGALKPGQISEPIPSSYGFHIVKFFGLQPERTLAFEDMQAALRQKLLRQKLEAAEAAYVAGLHEHYRVDKNERLLALIE